MTVADQPDRLSWLRQAGFLCLLVILCPMQVVAAVNVRDVAVRSIAFDLQNESGVMPFRPNIRVPEASKYDVGIIAGDRDWVFHVPVSLARRVLVEERNLYVGSFLRSQPYLVMFDEINGVEMKEGGCLAVVPYLDLEASVPVFVLTNDVILIPLEVTATRKISAFSLSGVRELFLVGGPERSSEISDDASCACRNNDAEHVKVLNEPPQDIQNDMMRGALLVTGLIFAAYLACRRHPK
jgi:hypothetical protein